MKLFPVLLLTGVLLVGPGSARAFELADMNCDGAVNVFDIDPFVMALTDPVTYAAEFPACDYLLADVNHDGDVNVFDIDPFVTCLTNGGCESALPRRPRRSWPAIRCRPTPTSVRTGLYPERPDQRCG